MVEPQQFEDADSGGQPGKTRTWWHPLLVRLLDYALSSAYSVTQEVLVGKMPLRVDILLVRRDSKEVPEARRRELSALLPLLNRYTLIEFKGPTDALGRGDFAQLVGCAYLWHSQQNDAIHRDEISLVVLAPTVNSALRDDLMLMGCEAQPHEPGVVQVIGLPFKTWLVETDVMASRDQPILTLVSRIFLKRGASIIEQLARTGHWALARYTVQQVHAFRRSGKEFAMQHALSESLAEMDDELMAAFLGELPAEQRLRGVPAEERLRGVPPEERVRGLPPEERVRGLPPEEIAAALSKEQAARLREILDRTDDK